MCSETTLHDARVRVEQEYFRKLRQGGKLRKNEFERSILQQHFDENPVWDYPMKIAICEQLNMTLAQVSKWNWDCRRRLGMGSSRKKKGT